jgi:hypothetical protein
MKRLWKSIESNLHREVPAWLGILVACSIACSVGLGIGLAIAQVPGLFIASPTGNEQINVLVPSTGTIVTSPQITTVRLSQVRDAVGYTLVAAGTTVNTAAPNTSAKLITTGAITTWNVTLPAAPYDGQDVSIACPGGTATVAVTATLPTGVAIVGTSFTACTSGGVAANTAEYVYSLSTNTWYRIQ